MSTSSRRRTRITSAKALVISYWTTTDVLVAECVGGGVMGALQLQPFLGVATHPGYPAYFMSRLGVRYLLAGVVLLASGLARLKE